MGIILAKFRKEKSTQEILEALQEKIDTLDTYTHDTQEQKKRFVGNFLASSIGFYILGFLVFYFVYFPPTWKERIVYSIPLLLFPFVIILLRYLFTWYFQRKLNKNSKKLTALRAEKKKILEQVMDKETYKVAVNLLARFADKPSPTSYKAMTSNLRTPNKINQPALNRSLPTASSFKSTQLALTPTSPGSLGGNNNNSAAPLLTSQLASQLRSTPSAVNNTPRSATTMSPYLGNSGSNQLVRRRTPFPVINQNEKGVFEKIVDVLIGDGPGDRFAMICKECYSHNGMALKEDFEYTTFKCAFCNAINPARKARPAAPRLSVMPSAQNIANGDSSSSDEKDDSDAELSPMNAANTTQFSTPLMATSMAAHTRNAEAASTSSSSDEEEQSKMMAKLAKEQPQLNAESKDTDAVVKADKKFENLEKSDSAIDDVTMSPEEN